MTNFRKFSYDFYRAVGCSRSYAVVASFQPIDWFIAGVVVGLTIGYFIK